MQSTAFRTLVDDVRQGRHARRRGRVLAGRCEAQPAGIDPEAQRLLKASTDFLASQQQFSADTRNTLEVVLKSGQKIEFNHTARLSVQRPNKLRAERTGDLVDQVFVYDGKSLTLHNPQDKAYAQVAAPDTLEGMLDFARSQARHRRAGRRPALQERLRHPDGRRDRRLRGRQGGDRGRALRPPRVPRPARRPAGLDPGGCAAAAAQARDHHARPAQRAAVRGHDDPVEPEADVQRPDLQLHAAGRREEASTSCLAEAQETPP